MGKTKKQETRNVEKAEISSVIVKEKSKNAQSQVTRILAGNTTACSPLILESSKIILLAYGSVVKSVCIQTGNLLTTYEEHEDIVTQVAEFPNYSSESCDSIFIISTSIDGVVKIWNLLTLQTMESTNIGSPILKMLLLPAIKDNTVIIEEKGNLSLKPSDGVLNAYFLIHPVDNNKDAGNQFFHVYITNGRDLQPTSIAPITTSSRLMTSFKFSLKPEVLLDSDSNAIEHALITTDNKHLVIHVLSKHLYGIRSRRIDVGLQITALASHSSSGLIAVGTQYGEIFLYRNMHDHLRSWFSTPNRKDKDLDTQLIRSKLVWHSHAVKSLAFSMDGRILYSGGEESVLTIWNLNRSLKSFIPRVGAPISAIVPFRDATQLTKVLLSSADNSLKLINTVNMEIEWNWQALYVAQTPLTKHHSKEDDRRQKNRQLLLQSYLYPYIYYDQPSDKSWKPSMVLDPASRNLAISGNLGHLQFLDGHHEIIQQKLSIMNFLRVSRKDSAKNLFVPTITHYQFSPDGLILVTADVKKNEDIYTERSLKFWLLSSSTSKEDPSVAAAHSSHELIAQMNAPHQESPITALAVGSKGTMKDPSLQALAATASSDGTVKVWRGAYEVIKVMTRNKENTIADQANDRFVWKCQYSFQHRIAPVLALSWSFDLSILAVAHDNVISFWDPQTVAMQATITDEQRIRIRYLSFLEPRVKPEYGGGCNQSYLVVGSTSLLRVYDLTTMTVLWTFSTNQYINACTIARDESEIWREPSTTTSTVVKEISLDPKQLCAREGWIAIACSDSKLYPEDANELSVAQLKKTLMAKESKTTTEGAKEKDEKESKKKQQQQQSKKKKNSEETKTESSTSSTTPTTTSPASSTAKNEVLLFSPISATPLQRFIAPSKIISLSFFPKANSQGTEIVTLTADSEVIAYSSSTVSSTASEKKTAIQVAQVKQPTLPVLIEEMRLSEKEEAALVAVSTKESLNQHLLKPSSVKVHHHQHNLKDFLPDQSKDLPAPSDITVDFLRAISSEKSSAATSSVMVSEISSATGPMRVNPAIQHERSIAANQAEGNQAFGMNKKKKNIDLDSISSILEKKIPVLAKRSFSAFQADHPSKEEMEKVRKTAKTGGGEEVATEPEEKHASAKKAAVPAVTNKTKAPKTTSRTAAVASSSTTTATEKEDPIKESEGEKKEASTAKTPVKSSTSASSSEIKTPVAAIVEVASDTENRRKTRRMTRSESDLSDAQLPASLVVAQTKNEKSSAPVTMTQEMKTEAAVEVPPAAVTKTPKKGTKANKKEQQPQKEEEKAESVTTATTGSQLSVTEEGEEEPARMTRSRQKRKDSESENDLEDLIEKKTPVTPATTTRASRAQKLATIPEDEPSANAKRSSKKAAKEQKETAVVKEKVKNKEATEMVAEEGRTTRSSTRKRSQSELTETSQVEEVKEAESVEGEAKRKRTSKKK